MSANGDLGDRGRRNAIVHSFPHDRRSDADLVREIAEGREEALAAVYRRHGAAIRRTLAASLGRMEHVEDLVQEVFLGLSRSAARIEKPERLRAYLIGAAIHQARQHIREIRRRRHWLGLFAKETGDACTPESGSSAFEGRRAVQRLDAILSSLPDRLRDSFMLRFVEHLPIEDVALARGVSLATAKRDVAKARERVLLHASRDAMLARYLRPEAREASIGRLARSDERDSTSEEPADRDEDARTSFAEEQP